VYVVLPMLLVLIIVGFHEPVMAGESVELDGKDGAVEFRQSGPIWVNVGIKAAVIVISIVVGLAH
jgi:hypothetical protein